MSTGSVQAGTRERIKITIAKDSMTASVLLRKPGSGEHDITVDEIKTELENEGIIFGLDEPAIKLAVIEKRYNSPIRVASGVKPKRGADSAFTYHFDTSQKLVPKEDDDGRIDYHDISFIQNTEKGALLVTKTPPGEGQPGNDVFGKEIQGPPGRDLPFKNGTNTEVAADALEVRATASGAIVFLNGKVSVNDVLVIRGDVDFNVGNLDCRGSVRVSGNIKAGFDLKIDGDLEVNGHVEDATIDVKGNIMVKGGFFGDGSGSMQAEGDITLKFAEGQKITSGGSIYVGGEIINCQVLARDKVIVKSRRGKIVGGEVRAGKEIRASIVGSEAGTTTKLYVAYDSKLMKRHRQILQEVERLKGDAERVKEALYVLYRQQLDGKLSVDKLAAFKKLQTFKKELPTNLEVLNRQKAEVEEAISKLVDARIIAEDMLHTGVRLHFGIVYREIVDDTKRALVAIEGNQVLLSAFKGD